MNIKRKSRGNFVILSGLIVAALVACVSIGVLKAQQPQQDQKPVITGSSLKPRIIASETALEKVDDSAVARAVGVNKAVKEPSSRDSAASLGAQSEADSAKEVPPVPAAIKKSTLKGQWIYIDKAAYRLYLVDGRNVVDSWGIAVGKNAGNKRAVGDMRTPEGTFTVQQIQNAQSWTHDFKDGKGVIKNAYGPWFIRLKTGKWRGIGIHGTHAPESIGTKATEGCIRLRDEDLKKLKPRVKIGMKVVIGAN